MSIEQQLRDKLQDCAEAMEVPSEMQKRVEQASYERYRNEKHKSKSALRFRLIAGALAVVLLTPVVIHTAPVVAAQIRALLHLSGTEDTRSFVTKDEDSDYITTNLYEDEVAENKAAQDVLARIYHGYPETRSFEIANAQITEGTRGGEQIHELNLILMEKGKTFADPHKEITTIVDVRTGAIQFFQAIELDPSAHTSNLRETEAIEIANAFLDLLQMNTEGYQHEVIRTSSNNTQETDQSIVIYKRPQDGKKMLQVNLRQGSTSVANISQEKS
ncbi:hypothetical protein [Paenibacillus terrigena]|uniref:hypothetical protein n=1 Tax=Paenibacillus terrigena TaxID=369333 RepID=UPI000377EDD4|nr:hypothetical protein [Paenibacillus terrigena]